MCYPKIPYDNGHAYRTLKVEKVHVYDSWKVRIYRIKRSIVSTLIHDMWSCVTSFIFKRLWEVQEYIVHTKIW